MAPSRVSRRDVLKLTAAAAGAFAVPYLIPREVLGYQGQPAASETVIVGFVGCGGRARQLMGQMPSGGRIVSVSDCFLTKANEAVDQHHADWKIYQDYRKMFDEQKLDAVVVATPDHIRVRVCIQACQAGKDVYAEKPLSAYIAEGRALVKAARKYKRVVQVGSQQRTMEVNRCACDFIRKGGLGKIKLVQAVCYPGSRRFTGLPEEPIPAGDDWDAWMGATPKRKFNSKIQFNWGQWWDYSGGETTNWGAHGLDQVQWALGMSLTGPTKIWRVGKPDPDKPTPVHFQYANGVTVKMELKDGPGGGAIFRGERGNIEINRNKFTDPKGLIKDGPSPDKVAAWEGDGWIARPHLQNWLDCIKTREKPNADVEIGHRSVSLCHLVNIAREVGRRLTWDPKKEVFVGDAAANKLLNRPRRKGYELPEV